MRILAGKFKNKTIASKLPGVAKSEIKFRPTTSKAREAVFNILQNNMEIQELTSFPDCNLLDLFAGSGIFTWEALSRGVSEAVLVETDLQHAKLLELNAELLGVEDMAKIMRTDARRLPIATKTFDVVFMDPPYKESKLIIDSINNMSNKGWLSEKCVIIIETAIKNNLNLNESYELLIEKSYGNTKILFYVFRNDKVQMARPLQPKR
jgi:16S rRNA (guanine966-N2)-methyltransferase